MEFFGASTRQVREAMKLKSEAGILRTPPKRKGHPVSEEIKKSIRAFYEDDSISYCFPGKKDVIHGHQERLLLSNLKEMPEEWKKTTHLKCGFLTFAGLRPPHCVLAGRDGTRTICVCMEPQNFKLMLHAAGIKETCEELVASTVCQLDNEKCMIGKCEKYPGTDHAEALLRNALALQIDEADGLQVQQWVKGTRCRLEALVLTQEDFCDRLLDMLR